MHHPVSSSVNGDGLSSSCLNDSSTVASATARQDSRLANCACIHGCAEASPLQPASPVHQARPCTPYPTARLCGLCLMLRAARALSGAPRRSRTSRLRLHPILMDIVDNMTRRAHENRMETQRHEMLAQRRSHCTAHRRSSDRGTAPDTPCVHTHSHCARKRFVNMNKPRVHVRAGLV